ncbi:MAG: hypothetical protein HY841_04495 [Bacteroidetes bacterium]|nr:hypothetical protein [Bacteroidota bacterium]
MFLIVVVSFLSFWKENGWAQDSVVVQKKSEQTIEFVGEGFLNSNTINNDFIFAFYKGDFIDSLLKESAAEKLLTSNRLGSATKIGLTYSHHPLEGIHKPIFSFSFFDRGHLDMKFSDDLFYTLFYGNKMFEGNTAYLGNFSLDFLRYQQFYFGWNWEGNYNHGSYGFAFSLLSGEQNISIKAPTADLFTANDGTYMDLFLQMEVLQTDTSQKKYFSQNGMGLSTDFYYEMPYEFWKKHGRITFEVKDLGFIRWNSNSMKYSVDSSYHYNGIDVNDLFNLDSSSSLLNIDSAIDRNTKFKKDKFISKIPCTFDIHTKSYYGTTIAIEKGIVWWFNTSAKPYFYAKLHFIVGRKKTADLAYNIGYGGYGRFYAGIEARIDFAKHYSLHVIDDYLFSGIAQTSYGMGLYVKLVRKF